ncbi:hypothetical protein RI367_003913 [Sorochytrium milnesiophthora]
MARPFGDASQLFGAASPQHPLPPTGPSFFDSFGAQDDNNNRNNAPFPFQQQHQQHQQPQQPHAPPPVASPARPAHMSPPPQPLTGDLFGSTAAAASPFDAFSTMGQPAPPFGYDSTQGQAFPPAQGGSAYDQQQQPHYQQPPDPYQQPYGHQHQQPAFDPAAFVNPQDVGAYHGYQAQPHQQQPAYGYQGYDAQYTLQPQQQQQQPDATYGNYYDQGTAFNSQQQQGAYDSSAMFGQYGNDQQPSFYNQQPTDQYASYDSQQQQPATGYDAQYAQPAVNNHDPLGSAFNYNTSEPFSMTSSFQPPAQTSTATANDTIAGADFLQPPVAVIQPIAQRTPSAEEQTDPFGAHAPSAATAPDTGAYSGNESSTPAQQPLFGGDASAQDPFATFEDVPVKDLSASSQSAGSRSFFSMVASAVTAPAATVLGAAGEDAQQSLPATQANDTSKADELIPSSASTIEQSDLDGLDALITQSKQTADQTQDQHQYQHHQQQNGHVADSNSSARASAQPTPDLFGGTTAPATSGDQSWTGYDPFGAGNSSSHGFSMPSNEAQDDQANAPWKLQPAPPGKRSVNGSPQAQHAPIPDFGNVPESQGLSQQQQQQQQGYGYDSFGYQPPNDTSSSYTNPFQEYGNSSGYGQNAAYDGQSQEETPLPPQDAKSSPLPSSAVSVLPPPPSGVGARPPMPIVRSNTTSQLPVAPSKSSNAPPTPAFPPVAQTPPPNRSTYSPVPPNFRPPSAPLFPRADMPGAGGEDVYASAANASTTQPPPPPPSAAASVNDFRQRSISSPADSNDPNVRSKRMPLETIPSASSFTQADDASQYSSYAHYDPSQNIQRPASAMSSASTNGSKTPTAATFFGSADATYRHGSAPPLQYQHQPPSASFSPGSKSPPYGSQQSLSQFAGHDSDIMRPASSASNVSRASYSAAPEVACVSCACAIPTGSKFCSWCGKPQTATPAPPSTGFDQQQQQQQPQYNGYDQSRYGYQASYDQQQQQQQQPQYGAQDMYGGYASDVQGAATPATPASVYGGGYLQAQHPYGGTSTPMSAAFGFPPVRGPVNEQTGTPRVPLISFSPSGQIVTMFPKVVTRYSSGIAADAQKVSVVKMYPGQISVEQLGDVLSATAPTSQLASYGHDQSSAQTSLIRIEQWRKVGPLVEAESKKEKEGVIDRKKRALDSHLTEWIAQLDQQASELARAGTEENEKYEQSIDRKLLLTLFQQLAVAAAKRAPAKPRKSNENVHQQQQSLTQHMQQIVVGLLANTLKEPHAMEHNPAPSQLLPLYNFLLNGERMSAAHYAAQHNLWPHALLIASRVDESVWGDIVAQFTQHELVEQGQEKPAPAHPKQQPESRIATHSVSAGCLRFVYNLFGANYQQAVSDLLPPSEHARTPTIRQLSAWRECVLLALQNPCSVTAQAISLLGDRLRSYGRFDAAALCHLLTPTASLISGLDHPQVRQVLLGSPHNRFPHSFHKDMEAFHLTEVYEFVLACEELGPLNNALDAKNQFAVPGSSSDVLARCILPHFQAYKVKHAQALADMGHTKDARAYIASATLVIRWAMAAGVASPYLHPALFAQIDELSQRLGYAVPTPDSEEDSSWFAKTIASGLGLGKINKGSFMDVMNRGLDKFIIGEEASTAASSSGQGSSDLAGGAPANYAAALLGTSAAMQRPHSTPPISPQEPVHLAQRSKTPSISLLRRPSAASATGAPPKPAVSDAAAAQPSYNGYGYSFDYGGQHQQQQQQPQQQQAPTDYGVSGYSGEAAAQSGYGAASYGYEGQQNNSGYESGYAPPQYQPYDQPSYGQVGSDYAASQQNQQIDTTTAGASPEQAKPAKKKDYFDEIDDLGFGNTALSKKAEGDSAAVDAAKTSDDAASAQEDKNKPAGNANANAGGSVFGSLKSIFSFKRGGGGQPGSTRADLGEANNFVYDPTLKRWVNKNATEEEKAAAAAAAAPPPPPPSDMSYGTTSSMPPPPASPSPYGGGGSTATPPIPASAVPARMGIPTFPQAPGGTSPLPPGGGSTRSLRGRSRYVDVFNPGSNTGGASSQSAPPSRTGTPGLTSLLPAPTMFGDVGGGGGDQQQQPMQPMQPMRPKSQLGQQQSSYTPYSPDQATDYTGYTQG